MAPMATSRREFLLSTTAFLAAAGCGFGTSSNSDVENIGGPGVRGKQVLEGELSLAVPSSALPRRIVSDFRDATGVGIRPNLPGAAMAKSSCPIFPW